MKKYLPRGKKSFWLISVFFIFFLFLIFIKQNSVKRIKIKNIENVLLEEASRMGIEFSSLELTENNDIVAKYKNIRIMLSSKLSYEHELVSLQKILKSTTIDKEINEIDFRFNKIILR